MFGFTIKFCSHLVHVIRFLLLEVYFSNVRCIFFLCIYNVYYNGERTILYLIPLHVVILCYLFSRLVMSPSDGRLHLVQNDPPPPDPPPSDRIQYVGKEFANRPDLTVLPGKPPPPAPQPQRQASFDNPVMESIAQAHPSLVINKSNVQTDVQTQAQPTRVIKMKKPAKKAALVKPMMAEDRDRSPPTSPHTRLPCLQIQPHKQQVPL